MALIGTLRNKMTKWVVGFVAVAIVSFILNDLFGNGPTALFGGQDNTVGEIAGHEITFEEFQAAVQERENNYILNFGRQAGEREMVTLRQQAWDLLIARYAITPQFEKVGVQVTADEVWDLIQGRNVDENVKLSFTDSAGNFDRTRLIQYLQSIDNMPVTAEPRIRWDLFKADLAPARARLKYENLLLKTNYITEAQAEHDYHLQNDVAEVKYLYVPFFALPDTAVNVAESDLQAYYNQNKEKYKAEQTRSLSYVTFPVIPSAQDSAAIREEMNRLAADFANTTEDSVFASMNTDGTNPYSKYNVASLPTYLNNQRESLRASQIIGPVLDGNTYRVMKIVEIGNDTTYQAKASHILFKWTSDTDAAKKEARDKARKVLAEIKAGADFASKAREHGQDGTATRGGDLGWFGSGQMVKPFEKAVFDAKKTGLLNDVVETEFGYHIISVTNTKDNTFYTVATIEREITPSDETQNEAFRKADLFATDLSGVNDFKQRATEQKLLVFDANDIATSARTINNLGEARQVVTWLFRDAKEGKVSTVFDLEDQYVVAVMTGETEKGYKPFDKVKEEITPLVRNQLKGKKIIEQMDDQTSLEDLAKKFGSEAVVNTSSDLKMNSGALPSVGFDPVAVGKAFALESGKRSKPFVGENGVLIIEMQNKTIAPAIGDYTMFRNQLLQAANAQSSYAISEALKATANIEDMRYKFY
ncbi:MAG: peptidylprolyl isomerase [Bacteroidota bacterium]